MNSDLINFRKELHQHPEISGEEEKTAQRIKKELKKYQPEKIITRLGGHGILARFGCSAGKPVKNILFRAELDAISVQEETDLAYQSKNKHKMHACGHDGHMTILLGLAKKLHEKRPKNVDVYLLFQPAEETGEGAGRVLDDPKFNKLKIDHAFALHNLPGFPAKSIICKEETFAAGSVGIDITIKGSSSHAAYPEKGLNPSVTVARLIQKIYEDMQIFVSDNDSNKLACTYIKMGERAFGISPGNAQVGFTIRSSSDRMLDIGVKLIREILKEMRKTFEGEILSEEVEPFSATVNSKEGTGIVKKVSEQMGYEYNTLENPFPWSEDFGEFRKQFPITIFGVGAGEDKPPLHSEKFDFDDQLIPVGIDMFSGIVDYYTTL